MEKVIKENRWIIIMIVSFRNTLAWRETIEDEENNNFLQDF